MRAAAVTVGFIGITASKMPELFEDHCDFILDGEPEAAAHAAGPAGPAGDVVSEPIDDLDSLPFPRWDLVADSRRAVRFKWFTRPIGGGFPLLASRGCPEFCTYCPHRILAGYRARSIANIADELERLCDQYPQPYVIFRDPLFSEQRDRCLALCDEIRGTQPGADLRGGNPARPARSPPARHAARGGIAGDELRRRIGRPGDAEEIGAPPDSAAASARDHRAPAGGRASSPRRSTCSGSCRTTGLDRRDDRLRDRLGSTFAQFKILTPYPGTPMFKQLEPLLTETDWEKFDGYTPTFQHPNLTERELRFLLGAAYTRFYVRPSYSRQLPRRSRTRPSRLGQPDGPPRQRSAHRARSAAGILAAGRMLTAISRYGARVLPDTEQRIAALQGPR
jgi:hypothetical protein